MSPDLGVGQVDGARMTPKFDFRAVGNVKMTPKFDARGGRKGKTTPQIRCPGYWIATLRSQWRERKDWIASLRSQWRGEGGLEKVKHWKSLKKIALSLFGNILSWVFSWVMNLRMKKSKWLPAGFWADFDTTFSRLFTGANLVALGFSGLYCAISWILERIYSSLFGGLLGVYSIIGNGSLGGELLQRWLPAGDAFFPNMWYLSVIGLAVVSLSFVIAQLVNKRKGNLTRFSFWLMLFFFVLLALPYVTMFCNGISYFLQQ